MLIEDENNGLSLSVGEKSLEKPVRVDFVSGSLKHRVQYGGGKSQLISKAIGLKKYKKISVIDATAGLGRDAFVLASLGCDVLMIERSEIIFALLEDGLARLAKDPISDNIQLKLICDNAIVYLNALKKSDRPDVIYIDPMFPERAKSALVKKEMRVLRAVVGEDEDADELLKVALGKAKKRVVVKRSKLAPSLAGLKPDLVYSGKSSRFDVYTIISRCHS